MTRIPEISARIRATPSRIPATTSSTAALLLLEKSLIPSSQITVVTPERRSTSRSSRCPAEGPPGKGFPGPYSLGPATWLPPIPAFTTATRLP